MFTITAIKADVGSGGGHTEPSAAMLIASERGIMRHRDKVGITDLRVTHTGDDICLLMVHENGVGSADIHNLAWEAFQEATEVAKDEGLYGAGQDLLVDAPSGNVRGAGPGVAEIVLDTAKRPAEAILIFTADKCGPGAFNLPLWCVFTSPMFCSGLMLPNMIKGFKFTIIDMELTAGDHIIELNAPEEHIQIAALLRDENRYGVQAIHSRLCPEQQVAAVSTDRLHSIAGEYKGKDDPVAIVRAQGIFPAPEEIVMPYTIAPFVAGDARGSHHMTLMPVPIDTPVTGPYCQPIVACMAYSVNKNGKLSEGTDMFDNPVWDYVRLKAQKKSLGMREQGFVGAAMLHEDELEYGPMKQTISDLRARFEIRE